MHSTPLLTLTLILGTIGLAGCSEKPLHVGAAHPFIHESCGDVELRVRETCVKEHDASYGRAAEEYRDDHAGDVRDRPTELDFTHSGPAPVEAPRAPSVVFANPPEAPPRIPDIPLLSSIRNRDHAQEISEPSH